MSLLKEAEKNVVKIAKSMSDMSSVFDALITFGNKCFDSYDPKRDQYFEGLTKMREAVYLRECEAIRNCFNFVGVGGEEAAEYSKDIFKKRFGGDYEIMSFLDDYGHIPASYMCADYEAFRKEIDEELKKIG